MFCTLAHGDVAVSTITGFLFLPLLIAAVLTGLVAGLRFAWLAGFLFFFGLVISSFESDFLFVDFCRRETIAQPCPSWFKWKNWKHTRKHGFNNSLYRNTIGKTGPLPQYRSSISKVFPEYFHTTENISTLWNWTKLWKLDFPTIFYNMSPICPCYGRVQYVHSMEGSNFCSVLRTRESKESLPVKYQHAVFCF